MRLLASGTVVLIVALGLWPSGSAAQETLIPPKGIPPKGIPPKGIPPKHHPWGAFQPGAWKRVCVVIETFDERGFVKNTTTRETKTNLIAVDPRSVTLQLDVIHEVAGKRFVIEPQAIKQGFHGDLAGEGVKAKASRPGQVVVEGRTIACTIVPFECTTPTSKTVTDVYYCPSRAPYILKRHTVTRDLEGKHVLRETTVHVVSLDWQRDSLPGIKRAVLVESVTKHPKGSTVTWSVTSSEVPGGVISHSSRELDLDNRLIRRSRLQLMSHGSEPEQERIGIRGRRRPTRHYKPRATIRYQPR